MRVVGVIPARLKSTRLPDKPLVAIAGLPMIVHVFKRAQLSGALNEVFVATDSREIYETVRHYGGKAIMTSAEHKTGSDRVAEAISKMSVDVVVNIQGDEPLLNPDHIEDVLRPLKEDPLVPVSVLVTPYHQKNSPSVLKAILDLKGNILYCSRTDLPSSARTPVETMWKISFIVPFRKDFLLEYTSWQQTPLEKIEFNEYLRILEHGYKIRAVPVPHTEISVDTPEDLKIVREKMKHDPIQDRYRKKECSS